MVFKGCQIQLLRFQTGTISLLYYTECLNFKGMLAAFM